MVHGVRYFFTDPTNLRISEQKKLEQFIKQVTSCLGSRLCEVTIRRKIILMIHSTRKNRQIIFFCSIRSLVKCLFRFFLYTIHPLSFRFYRKRIPVKSSILARNGDRIYRGSETTSGTQFSEMKRVLTRETFV